MISHRFRIVESNLRNNFAEECVPIRDGYNLSHKHPIVLSQLLSSINFNVAAHDIRKMGTQTDSFVLVALVLVLFFFAFRWQGHINRH